MQTVTTNPEASLKNIKKWAMEQVDTIKNCHAQMSEPDCDFDSLASRIHNNLTIISRAFGINFAHLDNFLSANGLKEIAEVYA